MQNNIWCGAWHTMVIKHTCEVVLSCNSIQGSSPHPGMSRNQILRSLYGFFFFFPKKLFRRKLKEGLEPKPKVFPTRCTPWLCSPLREIQKRMQTDGSWDSRVGILKSGKGLKIPMSSAFLPTNSPLYSAYNHWTLFLRIHLQMYLKVKMIISEEDRHSTSPMHFALRH